MIKHEINKLLLWQFTWFCAVKFCLNASWFINMSTLCCDFWQTIKLYAINHINKRDSSVVILHV